LCGESYFFLEQNGEIHNPTFNSQIAYENIVAVAEPSSILLFSFGLLGIFAWRYLSYIFLFYLVFLKSIDRFVMLFIHIHIHTIRGVLPFRYMRTQVK
jgi:hypothetical protein